jgi:hypothetical protein
LADSHDLSGRHVAHPPTDWRGFPGSILRQVLLASCHEKFRPHIDEFGEIYCRLERLAHVDC